MISIADAKKIIDKNVVHIGYAEIPSSDSVGRILAENICADMDLPPFDRSQMDGFAVIADDIANAPVTLKLIGESVAGKRFNGTVNRGEAVRIMTGAPVPNGADAVQMVEFTESKDNAVTFLKSVTSGNAIVKEGAEIRKGEKIFATGERIKRPMISVLASFGYAGIRTFRRPRVCILATGSEIVDIAAKPNEDQIRDSNSALLCALAGEFADVEVLPRQDDDKESIKRATESAECDVLLISGGVSVGDYDFTKPALRGLGAEILIEKIALKPGKPLVFARLGEKLVFGLPGNPVSVSVTFQLFVRRALLAMQGASNYELTTATAIATERLKATPERDSVLPVFVETDDSGRILIKSLKFSGSSNFIAAARANALVHIPQNCPINAGETATIYLI